MQQARQGRLVPLAHNHLSQAQQDRPVRLGLADLLAAMELLAQQDPQVARVLLESREPSVKQARLVLRVRKAGLDPPEHKDLWDLLERQARSVLLVHQIQSMSTIKRPRQPRR